MSSLSTLALDSSSSTGGWDRLFSIDMRAARGLGSSSESSFFDTSSLLLDLSGSDVGSSSVGVGGDRLFNIIINAARGLGSSTSSLEGGGPEATRAPLSLVSWESTEATVSGPTNAVYRNEQY